MKIHGKKIEGPNVAVLVLPRQEGDIVFTAKAVLKYDEFDAVNPMPKPPVIMRPGGEQSTNPNDKKYQEEVNKWATSKMNWMIIKSLEATDGLEWETVDLSKPETYENVRIELADSGLTAADIARIVNLVIEVNGLNQDKIDEATKRFLAMQQQLEHENSQEVGQ